MSLFAPANRLLTFAGRLFKKRNARPLIDVKIEDLKFIWNYQMVVVHSNVTIDLREPLLDIHLDLQEGLQKSSHLFPFIVGDHGTLISPKFGRRVFYSDAPQKTSIYLEYILDSGKQTRLILRIIGKDPQSIYIVKDERRKPELPIVLFMYKPKNNPQEI